jgi:asparagine synthase (glutamine-hydrolysing)
MCGLTGFLEFARQSTKDELLAQVSGMAETLFHRGPDDKGAWVDAEAGIALGFRRLSIVDLSPAGRQPMHSACGRYVTVFNGEIYNYKLLRQDLQARGHVFRSHSDTEVLLAAISRWGLETAVKRFNGMFAFALWDREVRALHLVRDRLGEKPLYYGWMGRTFLFGSELKALRAHPRFAGSIDPDALALYFRFNCIPAPYSIYKKVYKLPPATILTLNTAERELCPAFVPYWLLKDVAARGVANPLQGCVEEVIVELDALLRDSAKLRMVADVPLGAFLSGGIDSSTVVATMQAQTNKPVKTFSIGFHPQSHNEAVQAMAVARHLGTAHTELYVTPEQAMATIHKLPLLYDEPFADSSQIPTFLVCQLAREQVTVSLSGDGGDEIFGGYNRHFWAPFLWRKIHGIPRDFRRMVATALSALSPHAWEGIFSKIEPILPKRAIARHSGDKLQKLAEVMTAENSQAMYLGLVSHWKEPASLALGAVEPNTIFSTLRHCHDLPEFAQQMMYLDVIGYLPEDILVKLDRASMGVSLEARLPMLDHRLVEFAWQLPFSMKIRNGQGKWILRQVLRKYLPEELTNRPKMGFGVPIHVWLRGPLREWAESLLEERRLQQEGLLDPNPVRQKWNEHLSGKRNWQHLIWDVLMFEAWLDENKSSRVSPITPPPKYENDVEHENFCRQV